MYNRMMYRRCSCMNNNYHNHCNQDMIETGCQNVYNYQDWDDDCECGFEDSYQDVFPENPMLAQSYVPTQFMDKTFKPCVGLKMGTIYPELVSPYSPGQSMAEIEYLRRTNKIGEGCNSCR